ncbi:MAG TPA: glycosyltransferase [Aggregatilineaceae bacterium]|nr:glycosyltransferase [Aggregatilineaceae bacterium]
MRILFLTAQLPEPPHAGGALRTSGLMRGVHAAGHEIHLLSFADDESTAGLSALNAYCAVVEVVPPPHRTITSRLRDIFFTRFADMQRRFYSPAYVEKLTACLTARQFDLIQIESLEMAAYLPLIKQLQPHTPVIYDSFNAEYDLQRTIFESERRNFRRLPGAIYSFIQWRRLSRFERDVCQSVSHVIAVSQTDADAFARLVPHCPVSVVPNGITVANYVGSTSPLDLGPAALVFTGSMSYRPNVDAALWFATHILDQVRASVPDARLFVVGSHPHPRLDTLRERDDIEITGWVPEVNSFLHAAAVYVVPLRMGSGTRLKLLQAMAAGQAVVSTSMGAQGLDVRDGVELRLADTAADFASAVIELLEDRILCEKLGQAAAKYVTINYDWSVIVPRLLQIYDRLMEEKTHG